MISNQKFNNGLYLVATPIGNLEDISFRAITVLKKSKIILCENSNHSLKLLNKYDIKKKLIAIHDYNENKIINKIKYNLKNSIISLVSDAGSPLISDPGFKLVKHCIENKIYITTIPGPSSVIAAIQLSGIAANSFTFNGFIPKKTKHANELFMNIQNKNNAQIFFSSSHRIEENIKLMKQFFKDRQISICREITKINEQVIRTNINSALKDIKNSKIKIKGEFVLVIDGVYKKNTDVINKDISDLLLYISKKFSLTDTVKIVHKLTGLSKKSLYKNALLKIKK